MARIGAQGLRTAVATKHSQLCKIFRRPQDKGNWASTLAVRLGISRLLRSVQ